MNFVRIIYDFGVFFYRSFGKRNIHLYVRELSRDDNTLMIYASCDQHDSIYFIPLAFEKYGFRDFSRNTTHAQPDCFIFIIRSIPIEKFISTLEGDANFEISTHQGLK
ncbi:hypothetical protein Pan241w_28380 [Gimesia alba]|uniref:Uncharacterized protein n=1 Tax=Gimesia alba TaxID=2527973 RepID=A0A517RFU9_9PLAN|nr:hypothetical protein Pan241w_28380 [Gimesia alba]